MTSRFTFREVEGKRFAILFVTIVKHDFRAVTARRCDLRRRRIFRHRDQYANARFTTRQRHRLRVIARRKGDDALLLLVGCE